MAGDDTARLGEFRRCEIPPTEPDRSIHDRALALNIVIPADPAVIRVATDAVAEVLRNQPGVVGHEYQIELALQEALANAIRHGCQNDPTKFVQCCVTYQESGDLLIVVRDPGPGFDIMGIASPVDGNNLLKANGRGLFLMKQFMDEVRFADGGREVHMRKTLGHRHRTDN